MIETILLNDEQEFILKDYLIRKISNKIKETVIQVKNPFLGDIEQIVNINSSFFLDKLECELKYSELTDILSVDWKIDRKITGIQYYHDNFNRLRHLFSSIELYSNDLKWDVLSELGESGILVGNKYTLILRLYSRIFSNYHKEIEFFEIYQSDVFEKLSDFQESLDRDVTIFILEHDTRSHRNNVFFSNQKIKKNISVTPPLKLFGFVIKKGKVLEVNDFAKLNQAQEEVAREVVAFFVNDVLEKVLNVVVNSVLTSKIAFSKKEILDIVTGG